MKEDFKKFMELVQTDSSLKKRLEEAGKNYTGEQNDEAIFRSVVTPIAEEAGFDLSLDDVKESVQELNPDEMCQVAGGGEGSGGWVCLVIGAGLGRHETTDDSCIVIGTGLGACAHKGATF